MNPPYRQSGCFLPYFLFIIDVYKRQLLGYAVGTHHAPLVVVAKVVARAIGQDLMAAQPHLGDVLKAAVLVDFLRGNVAVIVYDGQLGRIAVIQVLGGRGLQQKVLVHKSFHVQNAPYR